MRKTRFLAALCVGLLGAAPAWSADLAAAFGALEAVQAVRLSPSGQYVSWIAPGPQRDSVLMVAPVDGGSPPKAILRSGSADGFRMYNCDWAGDEDLWCELSNQASRSSARGVLEYQRLLGVKRDGTGMRPLGRRLSSRALSYSTFDGEIIHTLKDEPAVLMRSWVPEETSEGLPSFKKPGMAVEKVNLTSNRRAFIERPSPAAQWFLTDHTGAVRMMAANRNDSEQYDTGKRIYMVRPKGGGKWIEIGRDDYYGRDLSPLGFDEGGDWLYVRARNAAGRLAVYRIAADESRRRELVFEDPRVDVDGLMTLGPQNRTVGVQWTDDVTRIKYFDSDLQKLDAQVGKAIAGRAIVGFTGESNARDRLLIYAGSDRDPGRYFLLDRKTRQLRELIAVRGDLKDVPLGEMREITYAARDGTKVPAYLTLPPGKPAKGLPLIVMPHGGPSARDSWGFDWLVQFYAAQGYAVVQPNYRGSSGFGKEWNAKTAIENWRTAVNDINDAAKSLAAQGIADAGRTAIVGWSYGGYAALQGSAMEPELYKAVVAIAPVTDWLKLRRALLNNETTAERVLNEEMGRSDSNLAAGSPVRNVSAIRAPVLMFHGDRDANVLIGQSRDMDAALKAAGKRSELVVYPGLAHSLVDGAARTDMLRRSAAFLSAAMGGVAAGAAPPGTRKGS